MIFFYPSYTLISLTTVVFIPSVTVNVYVPLLILLTINGAVMKDENHKQHALCEARSARCEVRGARCKVRGARCEVRGAGCDVRGAERTGSVEEIEDGVDVRVRYTSGLGGRATAFPG